MAVRSRDKADDPDGPGVLARPLSYRCRPGPGRVLAGPHLCRAEHLSNNGGGMSLTWLITLYLFIRSLQSSSLLFYF